MTVKTSDDVLMHFGVKGMRWGVRKAEKAQSEANRARSLAERRPTRGNIRRADRRQRRADKKFDKVDKKWEKSIYTTKGAVAVHNNMAGRVNAQMDAINESPKYKNTRPLDHPDSQLFRDYINDFNSLTNKAYGEAVTAVHGSSPSGKKHAVFVADEQGERIEVRNKAVSHAEDDEPDLVLRLRRGDNGLFVEVNMAEEGVAHTDRSDDFLMHYGVKGMRWGVRRDRSAVEVTPKTAPGRRVKARGGQNHLPSEDAITAAKLRQVAKKSTVDSLSNKELEALNRRMNLEQQYKSLNRENVNVGIKIKRMLFSEVNDQHLNMAGDFIDGKTENQYVQAGAKIAVGAGVKAARGPKKK